MYDMSEQSSPLILGNERISKLLVQYALPAIVAMTASSIYNMVDSIFIGHGVGALAIAGLALTFPLMNLAAAFGSLVGVGAATLISVKLGQKDYESAKRVLGNVLVLNAILGISFTLICLPFLDEILYFFGASEATLPYAREYMQIILIGNVVTHLYLGLNNVLRASGAPKYSMYATLASVIINCILNPIFIFGMDWGIKGSAWATVISQVISLTWQLYYFANPKHFIHFKKGIYKLKKDLVGSMFGIGLSPFLMNICSSLIIILINRGLKEYGGDMAIGAYGIVNRIAFLFVMIIMGLNQGMQPIAGYNFGARQFNRVKEVLKLTIMYAVGIATFGFLLCHLIPSVIVRMFTTDPELIKASVYGLHIVFAVYPLVGFQMVVVNFFQSIGKAQKAIFLSLTRQMIFLIPCLLILPPLLGVKGVWISLPIADFLSVIVSYIVLRKLLKAPL
jgi:putative MATE family efflux protein